MASYIPNTQEERRQMLDAIGCASVDELFLGIPEQVAIKGLLDLPAGLSEWGVRQKMEQMAAKNTVFSSVFRGAGAYKHYIPSIVKYITSKEEFVTAYTPYQAEVSQGVLQSIFEYQTMICELTGMAVSNASVYDGASAAAEAVIMCQERKRKTALISEAVNPNVLETVKTYCGCLGIDIETIPCQNGRTSLEAVKELAGDKTACVLIQQPNFYGQIEDAKAIGEAVHEAGAKYIISCNPIAAAVLMTPGECGADVAVGDGQPLGMPLSFGGPYLGFMAANDKMMRKLPGRIVGETVDRDQKRAFVLTLQAREQHIRREKASSNICSNQALCAMTAAVYMAVMGESGLKKTATACMSKAHYLAEALCGIEGFELVFDGPYFHEFVTNCPGDVNKVLKALEAEGILGGYPLGGELEGKILWCATELNTKEEMDRVVAIIKEVA